MLFRNVWRWILVGAVVVFIGAVTAAVLLTMNWPFTETAIAKTLQDRFARDVKIRKFRGTYFPPGCVAEPHMYNFLMGVR